MPGGRIEEGETSEDAARREAEEETGHEVAGELIEWTRRIGEGTDFTSYLCETDEFNPVLNHEADAHVWMSPEDALDTLKLHPGVRIALLRGSLDEVGVAKAMKAGELTSPQYYHGLLLVAMRITGTGSSYRDSLQEYVWRDPSLYLTDSFLERCVGLPVIMEHPEGNKLDSDEFRERTVGFIVQPWIKGDEVWGIAKIYDTGAIRLIEQEKLSTSPAVVFSNSEEEGGKYRLEDGSKLLIEGKPSLLDHLAICVLGVWDKGGPPSGISNDSLNNEGQSMANENERSGDEEERKDEAALPENSKEGDKVEMLLDSVKKLDARLDSLLNRKDAEEEEEKADAESGDDDKEEEEEAKEKADSDKEDELKEEDKGKEKADAEEEKMEKERKDSFAAMQRSIADLAKRMPKELPEEDRARFVAAQEKADRVAQAFGDQAPRWLNGESLLDYRKRLAKKYQTHSKRLKDADLSKIADSATLDFVEEQVYSDAIKAAESPESIGVGLLQAMRKTTAAGHNVVTYRGDCMATWAPFHRPARKMIRVNTFTGNNA